MRLTHTRGSKPSREIVARVSDEDQRLVRLYDKESGDYIANDRSAQMIILFLMILIGHLMENRTLAMNLNCF